MFSVLPAVTSLTRTSQQKEVSSRGLKADKMIGFANFYREFFPSTGSSIQESTKVLLGKG